MSMKDFTKGMAAGAKPFEEKFEQHADAIKCVADKLEDGMDRVIGVMNAVIDDMSGLEKKRLYDLNTQYDIKGLEDYEKELLLAALFTLAKGEANEKQQAFIRSVKKYLDIKNPQTEVDLSGIENIENLNSQKAMFQTFAEYLFLAHEDDSFWEEYADLFDLFSVKKRDRDAIYGNILQIYNAMGAEGICEKYGFVPAKKRVAIGAPVETGPLTTLLIEKLLLIEDGEEKAFVSQKIRFLADIECAGKLHFEDCVIVYDSASINGSVIAFGEAEITLSNCTVVDTDHKEKWKLSEEKFNPYISRSSSDDKVSKWLFKSASALDFVNSGILKKSIEDAGRDIGEIKDELADFAEHIKYAAGSEDVLNELRDNIRGFLDSNDDDEQTEHNVVLVQSIEACLDNETTPHRLICENSLLYNCKNFSQCFELHFSNNVIRYSDPPAGEGSVFCTGQNSGSEVAGCLIENTNEQALADILDWNKILEGKSYGYTSPFIFENVGLFSACTFKNLPRCARTFKKAERCEFINCVDVLNGESKGIDEKDISVSNCLFEQCLNVLENVTNVSNCQFSGCLENIVKSFSEDDVNPLHIEKCGFYNTKANNARGILGFWNKGEHTLEKCDFNGLDYRGSNAIEVSSECLTIEDCSFKNCKVGYGEDNDSAFIRISSTHFGGFLNKKKVGQEIHARIKNCPDLKRRKYFGEGDDSDDEGMFLAGQKGVESTEVPIMHKTAKGENIGSTVDPDEAGVPGFNPLPA
jgi:hypothetical protein